MFVICQTGPDGRIAAASRPTVHPSASTAAQEASRLAQGNPGVKYHVFEGVKTVEMVATYTEKVVDHKKDSEIPF